MSDRERRVRRFLAILRQLGVIAGLVFVAGFVAASIWPATTAEGLFALVLGAYVSYKLVDHISRTTLGSKYRPEGERPSKPGLWSTIRDLAFAAAFVFMVVLVVSSITPNY